MPRSMNKTTLTGGNCEQFQGTFGDCYQEIDPAHETMTFRCS